jgi:predicted AAA+ superfamily ATPase
LVPAFYPAAQRLSQRIRGLWLDSYIDRLLVRDVAAVSRGLSADRLRRVLDLLAANPAGELVKATPSTLARPEAAVFRGGLFEAFVTAELLKQRTWTQTPFNLYHFRDADGVEVDLVLEYEDSRVLLLEVKSGQTYRPDSVKAINALGEKLGNRFIGGAVLTMADQPQQLAQKVWGQPASALWSA